VNVLDRLDREGGEIVHPARQGLRGEVQEAERSRIARDLHDHIGQMLTALRLKMERLIDILPDNEIARNQVLSIREIAAKMDRDVAFLSRELRPTELDSLGLTNALASFVNEWSVQFGIDAEFSNVEHGETNGSQRTLPKDLETNIYRIMQEALNNVAKHSDAMHVSILLHTRPDSITLVVEDDGCGFDAERTRDTSGLHGFGLIGMRERTELLGGTFAIESGETGTSIHVRIPLKSAASSDHA